MRITVYDFIIMEQLAKDLEAFETDAWTIPKILDVEIMTRRVLDPCTGRFVLADEATKRGHDVTTIDVHQWIEDRAPDYLTSFLDYYDDLSETTVFKNPPFSLACEFVDHARLLNARKIICFQRYSWRESKRRGQWFEDVDLRAGRFVFSPDGENGRYHRHNR